MQQKLQLIGSLLKTIFSDLFLAGFYEVLDDKYLEIDQYQSTISTTSRIEKGNDNVVNEG
ncbi:unnamed protein product [Paramecium sonneborni]|uniref:Uncharacterized protein n=1 Tax=Paramecium sonneborni TaxID=65129 RepID=A0A8S1KKN0_9CILI|nr:unnamed protein product [Paramecium sonneborni]